MKELKNQTISHGTMRSEDLIPKFLEVLEELNPKVAESAKSRFEIDVVRLQQWNELAVQETQSQFLSELFDLLDQEAPEGFYFGSHIGNGSDYGFWQLEEE
tara:strand:- start:5681 stop:5983 length:303 start_codon:yes stop_codon:yes gene_type:complete